MKEKKQWIRNHRRRGITMVEVVIAMVIIAVVSASALSMVMMSVNVETNTVVALEAANAAENILDCFRYAEDEDTFLQVLQKTAPYILAPDGSLLLETKGCTITVRATFAPKQLECYGVDHKGEELFFYLYPDVADGEGGTS